MAIERDFITPAGMTVLTTANVVGNTTSLDMFSNTARSQSYPIFSQNFAMSPLLDSRFVFVRNTSGSYVAANGLIAYANTNVPRFEYDPITFQGKGLMLEEGRFNQVQNSSNMGGVNWGGYDGDVAGDNFIIVPNAGLAPDGSNTACFFRHNTDVNTYYVLWQDATNIVTNVTYTRSVFVKANTTPQEAGGQIGQYDNVDFINSVYISFGFNANGTISGWSGGAIGSNVQVHSVGWQNYPDGWSRFYYSFRYTSGGARTIQLKHELNGAGLTGTNFNARGVYWWGPQLEQGPFVTSFIPTLPNSGAARTTDYAYIQDDKLRSFKTDIMTVVDTTASQGYHGNGAMITSSEQRYNNVWKIMNLPRLPGPYVPAQDSRFAGGQEIGHYTLNNVTPVHAIQHYLGGFINEETYAGFNVFNNYSTGTANSYITDVNYVSTAMVLRSNNYVFVANGIISSTNRNYSGLANNNYMQIGPVNGYFKRLAIYSGQLSNTELYNITTT